MLSLHLATFGLSILLCVLSLPLIGLIMLSLLLVGLMKLMFGVPYLALRIFFLFCYGDEKNSCWFASLGEVNWVNPNPVVMFTVGGIIDVSVL